MIDKILENWLTKSSERSFQLPFCNLLSSEGYTIVHLTRHCGMEYGKDIIALDPNGVACAFQLKNVSGGKYGLKNYHRDIDQMSMLVLQPINHPSITNSGQHRSIFVINGEMEEEVFNAIKSRNDEWASRGSYKLETLVKGQILDWAKKHKNHFFPDEVINFKTLLEFQLEDGKGLLNKTKFSEILTASFRKESTGIASIKRIVSNAALLSSICLTNYSNEKNHFAVSEGWVIYISLMFEFCMRNDIAPTQIKEEYALAERIILLSIEDLYEEIQERKYLIQENISADVFIYQYRTTMLLGMVSYLRILQHFNHSVSIDTSMINSLLIQFVPQTYLWGESAIPYLLNIAWCTLISDKSNGDSAILNILLTLLATLKSQHNFFPDYYMDVEEAIILFQDNNHPNRAQAYNYVSHVMETILLMCSVDNNKDILKTLWMDISGHTFSEFQADRNSDIFLWRNEDGVEVNWKPIPTKSWTELKKESLTLNENRIPKYLIEFPQFIPLFLMVYPHRFQRDLVLYFHRLINS